MPRRVHSSLQTSAKEGVGPAVEARDEERASNAARAVSALPPEPLRIARRDAAAAFERAYVKTLLERSGGNITRAAAIAEVSRQMIQKLMRKYGL